MSWKKCTKRDIEEMHKKYAHFFGPNAFGRGSFFIDAAKMTEMNETGINGKLRKSALTN